MKFLCLAYEEENALNALNEDEWQHLRRETLEYVDELRRSRVLLATEPLRSAKTARTVRVRKGEIAVSDGPFMETKEQLGGYFLIEADDHETAVVIASRWPSARIGSIEVRPIEDGLPEDRRYR